MTNTDETLPARRENLPLWAAEGTPALRRPRLTYLGRTAPDQAVPAGPARRAGLLQNQRVRTPCLGRIIDCRV